MALIIAVAKKGVDRMRLDKRYLTERGFQQEEEFDNLVKHLDINSLDSMRELKRWDERLGTKDELEQLILIEKRHKEMLKVHVVQEENSIVYAAFYSDEIGLIEFPVFEATQKGIGFLNNHKEKAEIAIDEEGISIKYCDMSLELITAPVLYLKCVGNARAIIRREPEMNKIDVDRATELCKKAELKFVKMIVQ